MTPDPMRATAERLAREVHDKHARYGGMLPLERCDKDVRERSIALVLAGLTHRDRTAEREAARKAWDAAADTARHSDRVLNGWRVVQVEDLNAARDRYLAAEFDAGERVTLSDGRVVEWTTWEMHGGVPNARTLDIVTNIGRPGSESRRCFTSLAEMRERIALPWADWQAIDARFAEQWGADR